MKTAETFSFTSVSYIAINFVRLKNKPYSAIFNNRKYIMDVLRPETQWIGSICYRINPGNFGDYNLTSGELPAYSDETEMCYANQLEDESEECDVEVLEGGRHKCSFHVAKVFFAGIIGRQGSTRRELERETRTSIVIPRMGQDGDIVVTGSDRKSVLSAKQRIEMIVQSLRRRQSYTHFVSVPFNDEAFKNGFLTFKKEILDNCKSRGIDEFVFQNPEKLHFTICLMSNMDEIERRKAASVLLRCKEDVIKPILINESLELELSGIDYMNDDPTEVKILYGKVQFPRKPELLEELVEGIMEYFVAKGLSQREHDRVKIHVTLMNTRFRKDNAKDSKTKDTFDASLILKDYADFYFGRAVITHIDLSLMSSATTDGYYQATATIPIP